MLMCECVLWLLARYHQFRRQQPTMVDVVIAKDAIGQCRVEVSPAMVLEEGCILLEVEKFSFTANNVSYIKVKEVVKKRAVWGGR